MASYCCRHVEKDSSYIPATIWGHATQSDVSKNVEECPVTVPDTHHYYTIIIR